MSSCALRIPKKYGKQRLALLSQGAGEFIWKSFSKVVQITRLEDMLKSFERTDFEGDLFDMWILEVPVQWS